MSDTISILLNHGIRINREDAEAIRQYERLQARNRVIIAKTATRLRAERIREVSASVKAARIVAEKSAAEFDRIVRDAIKHDNKITRAIRPGVLPENC